jgi:hypothetical protein
VLVSLIESASRRVAGNGAATRRFSYAQIIDAIQLIRSESGKRPVFSAFRFPLSAFALQIKFAIFGTLKSRVNVGCLMETLGRMQYRRRVHRTFPIRQSYG